MCCSQCGIELEGDGACAQCGTAHEIASPGAPMAAFGTVVARVGMAFFFIYVLLSLVCAAGFYLIAMDANPPEFSAEQLRVFIPSIAYDFLAISGLLAISVLHRISVGASIREITQGASLAQVFLVVVVWLVVATVGRIAICSFVDWCALCFADFASYGYGGTNTVERVLRYFAVASSQIILKASPLLIFPALHFLNCVVLVFFAQSWFSVSAKGGGNSSFRERLARATCKGGSALCPLQKWLIGLGALLLIVVVALSHGPAEFLVLTKVLVVLCGLFLFTAWYLEFFADIA